MHPQHFLHVCDVVYISYIIFFELPVDVTTLLQRDVKGAVPFNGRFSFINTRHDMISEQFKIILWVIVQTIYKITILAVARLSMKNRNKKNEIQQFKIVVGTGMEWHQFGDSLVDPPMTYHKYLCC